jgi:hypothetical protein
MERAKIISISIPEYTIETQPNYITIGQKIDNAVGQNFDGGFLSRCLSLADHPQYNLDQFADIIVNTGTDKYDPNRKGVAHEEFEPYNADLQASEVNIENGKIIGESFGEDIKRFYENAIIDRGYRLRIDLIVLYDPKQMVKAEKIDKSKPGVSPNLEQYLWRFKNPDQKALAVKGLIKILR